VVRAWGASVRFLRGIAEGGCSRIFAGDKAIEGRGQRVVRSPGCATVGRFTKVSAAGVQARATEGRDGALSRHGAARPSAELPRRPPPVSKREYATGGRDSASSHHRAARRSANLPQVSNRGFNRSHTPACALAREAFWRRLQDRPPPATTRRPPATKPAKTSRYARRSAQRRAVR